MKIRGACHCGNLSFVFAWPGEPETIPVRACTCSFCVPRGAAYTSHPQGSLIVEVRDETLLSKYRFGTETADFYVCGRCGGVPVVVSEIDGKDHAVVNIHYFQGVGSEVLSHGTASFDREGTEERLARRARGWIPDVEVRIKAQNL